MSSPQTFSRREIFKFAATAAVALPVLGSSFAHAATAGSPAGGKTPKLKIAVAGYSLRMLTVDATIEVLKQLEVTYFSPFRAHLPIEAGTVEECREGAKKFRDAGLTLASTGVVNLTNNEAKVRVSFENAKAAGLSMMTVKPDLDAFPLVERFVKEYDMKVAIHNHGPEDKVYPSPYDAWKAIKPYDARIGLCIDVGHSMRAGTSPAEAILKCRDRVYDVHLKDTVAIEGAVKDIPVEAGRGRIDLHAVMAALVKIKYQGVMGYEYEKIATNPVIGLAESIGYVRGLLSGLA